MSPILKAFLKAGWIQVGEGVPVFFKYQPTDIQYPFRIVFTEDAYAYFDLYDKWIKEERIKEEILDEKFIQGLVNSAFDHTFATSETFHTGMIDILYNHYKYALSFQKTKEENDKLREKSKEYDDIFKYLVAKKKQENGKEKEQELRSV
jgi:hypothetical protein